MRTVAMLGAACEATSTARRHTGELPTISRVVRSLISSFSERFSATSFWRSAAFFTLFTIESRFRGFSTKS
jgi:hypothetical protein